MFFHISFTDAFYSIDPQSLTLRARIDTISQKELGLETAEAISSLTSPLFDQGRPKQHQTRGGELWAPT